MGLPRFRHFNGHAAFPLVNIETNPTPPNPAQVETALKRADFQQGTTPMCSFGRFPHGEKHKSKGTHIKRVRSAGDDTDQKRRLVAKTNTRDAKNTIQRAHLQTRIWRETQNRGCKLCINIRTYRLHLCRLWALFALAK